MVMDHAGGKEVLEIAASEEASEFVSNCKEVSISSSWANGNRLEQNSDGSTTLTNCRWSAFFGKELVNSIWFSQSLEKREFFLLVVQSFET